MFTPQKQPGSGAYRRDFSSVGEKGFSLFELLVVLGIVTVLAAVAVPLVMQNVPRYKLKGAARTLVNDFQKARVEAVKRNRKVEIWFAPAVYVLSGKAGSYQIVEIEVGGGTTVLLSRQMPEYVTLYATNFAGNIAGYNTQGLPSSTSGSVFLRNNKSTYYELSLSGAGHVSLTVSTTDPS